MWVKGQSGNPAGRPKGLSEVQQLAKQYTTEAIERLLFWMRSDKEKASVSACIAILDRGHGKPAQALNLSGDPENPIESKHIIEFVNGAPPASK